MAEPRKRVLGVLAGGDLPLTNLGTWARSADVILAADGGADRLIAAGVPPHVTVGDLDSLVAQGLPDVRRDTDQETSDADKLLALCRELGHSEITLTGLEGDRLDHVLGTLGSAARCGLDVRLAMRRGLAWVVLARASVPTAAGDLVSLMPIGDCQGVSIRGVEWPLSDVALRLDGRTSLSNRATGDCVEVVVGEGTAALFVLAARLEEPSW